MTRFGLTAVTAAALVLAVAPPAAGKRARPTDVPPGTTAVHLVPNAIQVFNDYVTPPRAHASQRTVVHYVVLGIDAPPLNDDDGDGVPDYVERVGEAADAAIAYFERRGFARILADAGGPDARPDIYVSRFAAGYFGVAFPAAAAEGGAFVAVSNGLDPSGTQSLGSLYGTVAHELFHLIQFSTFRPGAEFDLPSWALEGMAAAMERRVYPELDDIVSSLQLRHWFAAPHRSITRQSYGAQLLWRFVDERRPRVAPAFLARVAQTRRGGAATLVSTYERITGERFAPAFGRFADWVGDRYGDRLAPPTARPGRTSGSVAPLGIHYLRVPRSARSLSVRFVGAPVPVTLAYELESDAGGEPPARRRLTAHAEGATVAYRIPASIVRNPRFHSATLVIANGSASTAAPHRITVR